MSGRLLPGIAVSFAVHAAGLGWLFATTVERPARATRHPVVKVRVVRTRPKPPPAPKPEPSKPPEAKPQAPIEKPKLAKTTQPRKKRS
ncbi:MAG: hypothetical protein D6806_08780, partial [Deltaproteobacteria bacterium]